MGQDDARDALAEVTDRLQAVFTSQKPVNVTAVRLMAAWEVAESRPVTASFIPTFVDMARVVVADHAAALAAAKAEGTREALEPRTNTDLGERVARLIAREGEAFIGRDEARFLADALIAAGLVVDPAAPTDAGWRERVEEALVHTDPSQVGTSDQNIRAVFLRGEAAMARRVRDALGDPS